MKAVKWLDEHMEETLLCVFLVLITVVSFVQIIARVFFKSLPWPEEFCRICWIMTVFISLPFTIRKGNMLRVSVLADLLPNKLRNALNILIDLIIAACMAIFLFYAIPLVISIMERGRTTTALQWPMGTLYLVTIFGYGMGTVRALQQAVLRVLHFNKKEMTTLEATMAEAAEEAAAAGKQEEGETQ